MFYYVHNTLPYTIFSYDTPRATHVYNAMTTMFNTYEEAKIHQLRCIIKSLDTTGSQGYGITDEDRHKHQDATMLLAWFEDNYPEYFI